MSGLGFGFGQRRGGLFNPAAPVDPYGPECWPQPEFDASTGLTLTKCTVSGGQLHFPGADDGAERCTATSLETITAGDYYWELDVAATDDGAQLSVTIGSTSQAVAAGSGLQTGTLTSIASNQLISAQCALATNIADFNSFTVKRVN